MTARNACTLPSSPPAREAGIRRLVDDAHVSLPADRLAELLLAVRRTIEAGAVLVEATGEMPGHRPGASPDARVYLRPIELLVHGQARPALPLPVSRREALLSYIEDVAARPRGAGLLGAPAV